LRQPPLQLTDARPLADALHQPGKRGDEDPARDGEQDD
jgi:hypothetical protein